MNYRKLALALMLPAATAAMAQGEFSLTGTAQGMDGQTLYLMVGHEGGIADSAVVNNGAFVFKGTLEQNYNPGVLILGKPANGSAKYVRLYLEPTAMTCAINPDDIEASTITGSRTQDENTALFAPLRDDLKKMRELNDRFYAEREAGHKATVDSIERAMAPIGARYRQTVQTFMDTHPDSYLTAEFLTQQMGRMKPDSLQMAYDRLSDRVKKSGACKEIEQELATLAKVAPGKLAPDFTTTDINGQPFTMSSLRGKVVIIDFWASWCVPCRKSNPHMVALHQKYHDKGLDLVYVADDDASPDKWRAAVKKDGLEGDGFHHVLRGLKRDDKGNYTHETDISDRYAIHFLPTKYLIGRDGKVIYKVESEKQLDATLAELMK